MERPDFPNITYPKLFLYIFLSFITLPFSLFYLALVVYPKFQKASKQSEKWCHYLYDLERKGNHEELDKYSDDLYKCKKSIY